MNKIIRIPMQYVSIFLWAAYLLYLFIFGNILHWTSDIIELVFVVSLQYLILFLFIRVFKEKYNSTINLTNLACCLLVIIWHIDIYNGISKKIVLFLFFVTPIIIPTVIYFFEKIMKTHSVSIFKKFGVSLLLTISNLVDVIFTFYILHYWI